MVFNEGYIKSGQTVLDICVTYLRKSEEENKNAISIDSLNLRENIDSVKIDLEWLEVGSIKGMRNLLK